ncbi:MAG: c-type cytochrome [Reyranella sp.]|uniref:c-type cytochrome n=1 Tax=Reyranella sp. TaxID=1929291 RepID=UPI00272F1686|nr:c-type cytochrome [Reyranella sp.]MDP1963790.1 c-type cytochrome [Reyranella sp.]MDP2374734.1 c-type cytochrome [Reyranella sp.]
MKTLGVGLAALAFLVLASGIPSGGAWADESGAAAAKKDYEVYCVQCHGLRRNGTGVNVPHMSVKPRDHTDAKAMGDLPDDQIFRAIKEGGLANNKSVLMPSFGAVLSDDKITDMVAYLRQVCKCGPSR